MIKENLYLSCLRNNLPMTFKKNLDKAVNEIYYCEGWIKNYIPMEPFVKKSTEIENHQISIEPLKV